MKRLVLLTLVGAIVSAPARDAHARQPAPPAPGTVAFLGVNLVSMEDERIRSGHTVIVRRDRIVAIGPDGQVPIPQDALHVPGAGRYLTPGLTDAHVHLDDLPFAHTVRTSATPRCTSPAG